MVIYIVCDAKVRRIIYIASDLPYLLISFNIVDAY